MIQEKIPTATPMNPRPRKQIDTKTYEGRFAERLKMLREKAKLTPEGAAEAIGVSFVTIYDWEGGRQIPTLPKFPKIAEVYQIKRVKDLLPNE